MIRGLEAGRPVERTVTVTSVDRGLAAARDWETIAALFATEAEAVVSNMGDAGYAVDLADRTPALLRSAACRRRLLASWWFCCCGAGRRAAAPLVMLPCELINRNGDVLRDTVTGLARRGRGAGGFPALAGPVP